jgi:hypothetical protein
MYALAVHEGMVSTEDLAKETGLSAARFNLALERASQRGVLKFSESSGPGPVVGGWLEATDRTRSIAE